MRVRVDPCGSCGADSAAQLNSMLDFCKIVLVKGVKIVVWKDQLSAHLKDIGAGSRPQQRLVCALYSLTSPPADSALLF